MKEQPYFQSIYKNLGSWTVPLISVASFVPLAFFFASSPPPPSPPPPVAHSILPPPSQLSPPVITPDPVIPTPKPQALPPKKTVAPTPKAKPTKNVVSKRLPPAPEHYQPPQLEIKVAIAQDASNISLGTSTIGVVTDRQGTPIKTLRANQGARIIPTGESLSMDGFNLPGVVFIEPSQGGLVYINDRWYRGRMLLVSQGNTILAVNYLDLEKYLYSVVGSEMHHNAPTEALKAQAIAARSYALVHMIRPASAWFNLGNTQRWQVYKGLQSESNTGHFAVNQTSGQILSYKGGVVESLYAATDEIVARAHGGRGMSQTGAYDLAKTGYNYEQILGNYYPGVGLARLVLQTN
jgi:peptidoglycan hydrolase-like amidase